VLRAHDSLQACSFARCQLRLSSPLQLLESACTFLAGALAIHF